MLNLALYYQTKSLYKKFFLENTNYQFVVPGPSEADEIRKTQPEAFILTIAEFLRTLQAGFKANRKSELYHYLGILCKSMEPDLKLFEFDEVFKWLTDIRNNVTDQVVLEELFSSFDKRTAKLLNSCSTFLDNSEFCDEAKLYKKLMDSELDLGERKLVFVGFKYLSSIQLDFLSKISESQDVLITYPKKVYESSEHTDWLQWGDFNKIETIDEIPSKNGKVKALAKPRLASFVKDLDFTELCYFKKEIGFSDYLNTGQYNSGLKENIDFFKIELDWLKRVLGYKKQSAKDMILFLDQNIKLEIKNQNPKKLKILFDFKKYLEKSRELTDSFEEIDDFKLRLLFKVIELDLPRISIVSQQKGPQLKNAKGSEFSIMHNSVGFLEKSFFELQQSFDSMPVELKRKLGQLGVIKRVQLEEAYNKFVVENFLSCDSTLLIYEKTEELEDYFLEFEEYFGAEQESRLESAGYLGLNLSEEKRTKVYSASRLQTYIDCPRKYHFQYQTDKLRQNILGDEVSAFEKGNWEHLLIQSYFEENITESKKKIFLEKKLEEFLEVKSITQGEKELVKADSIKRASNGIDFVSSIKVLLPESTLEFEKMIKTENFRGSIDFYVKSGNFIGVIDFKRSKTSIPPFSDVKNFDSIQVMSYLNKVGDQREFFAGYFCLDNPVESLFFGTKKVLENYKQKEISINLIEEYDISEKKLISEIEADKVFLAKPRKPVYCTYCDLRNICEKQ